MIPCYRTIRRQATYFLNVSAIAPIFWPPPRFVARIYRQAPHCPCGEYNIVLPAGKVSDRTEGRLKSSKCGGFRQLRSRRASSAPGDEEIQRATRRETRRPAVCDLNPMQRFRPIRETALVAIIPREEVVADQSGPRGKLNRLVMTGQARLPLPPGTSVIEAALVCQ